ncbi:MAG TPA: hypothetical protein VJ140_05095 [Actinomycetota bacterium]|nr:hypothetical protein [Actinomycetota bacterium]
MSAFSPLPTLRAAGMLWLALRGLYGPPEARSLWVLASLAMLVEVVYWFPRFTVATMSWPRVDDYQARKAAKVLAVVAGFLAYAVVPLRVAAGLVLFVWWAIGWPVLDVNRTRAQTWHADRTLARIERATTRTRSTSLAIKGCAHAATLRLRRQGKSQPEAPAVESLDAEHVEFVSATGVLRTDANGAQRFEPMEITR